MLIIPTYNERDNIATLVSRIRAAVGDEPIFFVDDNSPDGTADEIRRLQQRDPNIHLMARSGKGGYGSACRDAMKKILQENLADYVIQSDADLSHPPELLPRMLEMLRMKPCQVVIGSRYVRGGGAKNWSLSRRTLSFGANLYARLFTGVPVHDMTAGFVGYRTDVLRKNQFRRHSFRGLRLPDGDEVHPASQRHQLLRIPHHFLRARVGTLEVQSQNPLRRHALPPQGAREKSKRRVVTRFTVAAHEWVERAFRPALRGSHRFVIPRRASARRGICGSLFDKIGVCGWVVERRFSAASIASFRARGFSPGPYSASSCR